MRRRTPLVVLGVGKFDEVGLKVTQFLLAPLLCVLSISCSSGDRKPSQSVQQTNSSGEVSTSLTSDFDSSSESDSSLEEKWRLDLIDYFTSYLPVVDGGPFEACFVDELSANSQTNYSDLFVVVDFIVRNGASEDALGSETFRAVEAAIDGCEELVGEGDVDRVGEIVKESGRQGAHPSAVVGDEEARIYYILEDLNPEWGEPYFESIGDGAIKVVLSDVFGNNGEESHGDRVRDTFLTFAPNEKFTLFTFEGGSGTSFRAIHADETVVISASSHEGGDPFAISDDSYQEVEALKGTNALYISSLENAGVDGDPELGVYPFPHAGNVYVIENDPDAMDQTLFIAWYWDFSEMWGEASSVSSRQGSVDLHGDFVARNLENTVFVELPLDYEFADTSHATPIAAARAVELLSGHPGATAQELKQLVLAETDLLTITVGDTYYDESRGSPTDPDAYISYSEEMTVNVLALP